MPEWLKIFADLGAFGLLAWLIYHVFNKMLPDRDKDFAAILKAQRDDHVNASAEQRKDHAQAITTLRADQAKALDDQRDSFLAFLKEERETTIAQIALMRESCERERERERGQLLAHLSPGRTMPTKENS